jgi:hypothetical protein
MMAACIYIHARLATPLNGLPIWARFAGVLLGVGVQREHRRVEHRRCDHIVRCMRRLFGPVQRGGTTDAFSCVSAQACGHAHARMPTCVVYLRIRKTGFMYVWLSMYIYMYALYIYT